ncbi:MAG: flagellar motor protein MotB [Eubacteriales bacterium]|nr:flagellar motor protein MotB [Eubacteriales bacterium]
MSRKRKKEEAHEMNEAWLLPYSDLMTLLLAVFIVLFAVSQIDSGRAQQVSDQFTESMRTDTYGAELSEMKNNMRNVEEDQQSNLQEVKEKIDNQLQIENMTAYVTTEIDERGLVISLSNAIFFDPGSAAIKSEYTKILMEIAGIISEINNYIRIEGHTDTVPMSSEVYPSNWELSSARAARVGRMFIDQSNNPPERFLTVGYGEYRPIADNATPEGRAKNRRIDIIVLSGQFDEAEKGKGGNHFQL